MNVFKLVKAQELPLTKNEYLSIVIDKRLTWSYHKRYHYVHKRKISNHRLHLLKPVEIKYVH